jgi:hypothetical protein
MCLRSILDDVNALRFARIHEPVQVDDLAIQMNRYYSARAWRHGSEQVVAQRKVGMAHGLYWYRRCPTTEDGNPGCDKRMGRDHYLVARTNAQRFERKGKGI